MAFNLIQPDELYSKLTKTVTPAEAVVLKRLIELDSGFRRNDGDGLLQLAHNYEFNSLPEYRVMLSGFTGIMAFPMADYTP